MGDGHHRSGADAEGTDAHQAEWRQQVPVAALDHQHAAGQQQSEHAEPHGQHPPAFLAADQVEVEHGEGQPDQQADAEGDALEVDVFFEEIVAVFALHGTREAQVTKPQGQLVGIGIGADVIQPGSIVVGHFYLFCRRPLTHISCLRDASQVRRLAPSYFRRRTGTRNQPLELAGES
ncbi:hypothetical protein D3C81_1652180 [compost metagenome]